jgi:hypothetical protein
MVMGQILDKTTSLRFSIKDFIGVAFVIFSVSGVYFTLKADIAEAKELPKPVLSEQEYKYKDEVVRKTILLTQKDVDGIKEDIKEIKETLSVLEQRLYDR